MTWRAVGLGGGVAVAVLGVIGATLVPGGDEPVAAAAASTTNTARVERGDLSAAVSQDGTLRYRARTDGTPYAVVGHSSGTFTKLPEAGDRVSCGGVLYRVDDRPVLLLCGALPAYRNLRIGSAGKDVRQLNRGLHALGYDTAAGVKIGTYERQFTTRTAQALKALQRRKGMPVTGALSRRDAVFAPEAVRVAKVYGVVGGPARPGASVVSATSDRLQVQINLDASQQGAVERGDRARVVLPGNVVVSGRVDGFGRVAEAPSSPNGRAADATIPTYVTLASPGKARGLDRAPVQVDITTDGVKGALSVPVTAIVGKAGGGFAVEVVRSGGRRELVGVKLGLFDSGGGRIQVEGGVREGDAVVVPAS